MRPKRSARSRHAAQPGPWSHRARTIDLVDAPRLGDLRVVPTDKPKRLPFAPSPLTGAPTELRSVCTDTINRQLEALWAKDPYTARHSMQVETYAKRIAEHIGLGAADVEIIRIAAVLHDIGKIGIPTSILTKPGPLTREEFEVMKQHSLIGAAILQPVHLLECLLPLVLYHHEWYDGSGYPLGLQGEDIPFGARIVQAADCIDAMISPRSYKRGRSIEKAISELEQESGIQFDPLVAAAAIRWLRNNPQEVVTQR